MNKNIREKQKILVGSIVIVLCLIALGFMYQNNIKAYFMGIDVRYLDDPLYCEGDEDCVSNSACKPINKYYFGEKKKENCQAIKFPRCNTESNQCYLEPWGPKNE